MQPPDPDWTDLDTARSLEAYEAAPTLVLDAPNRRRHGLAIRAVLAAGIAGLSFAAGLAVPSANPAAPRSTISPIAVIATAPARSTTEDAPRELTPPSPGVPLADVLSRFSPGPVSVVAWVEQYVAVSPPGSTDRPARWAWALQIRGPVDCAAPPMPDDVRCTPWGRRVQLIVVDYLTGSLLSSRFVASGGS